MNSDESALLDHPTKIRSIAPTLSPQGLAHLKKERRAYYIILTLALLIGTTHEKAIITATSTFYVMIIGFFTANKYLRDHPNITINSLLDLVRLNYVNYIFLSISIINWWNDIFLDYKQSNLILVFYGVFVFEMMLLSSLLYFQLVKTSGNLRFMSPTKDLFKDQRSIIKAVVGVLLLSLSQAIYIVIYITTFPEYLLIGELLGIVVITILLYYLTIVRQFIPYDGSVETSLSIIDRSVDTRISSAIEGLKTKKTVIRIYLLLLVIAVILFFWYYSAARIQVAILYAFLIYMALIGILIQFKRYRDLKTEINVTQDNFLRND